MSDLANRLRAYVGDVFPDAPSGSLAADLRAAADALDALTAQRDAARRDCEKADDFGTRAELGRLKAEAERDALQLTLDVTNASVRVLCQQRDAAEAIAEKARAYVAAQKSGSQTKTFDAFKALVAAVEGK